MISEPGCYTIPASDYHADPCPAPSLSASVAHVLLTQSAAHARFAHPRLNPAHEREDEPRFDVGTAAHALILEGDADFVVADFPDWRSKAAQAVRQEAIADGKRPILGRQWQDVLAMKYRLAEQLARFDDPPIPFTGGKAEQSLVWKEGEVWLRSRLDWLHDDHLVVDDLKTVSGSANPDSWTRALFGLGHDVQAALYVRGVKAVFGVEPAFRFVVAEAHPPYALSVVSLGPAAMMLAEKKVNAAIEAWRHCLETGRWPSYPARVCYAELPGWEETRWLEREVRDDGRPIGELL